MARKPPVRLDPSALRCPDCGETFAGAFIPHQLPCGHLVCGPCVASHARAATCECPVCEEPFGDTRPCAPMVALVQRVNRDAGPGSEAAAQPAPPISAPSHALQPYAAQFRSCRDALTRACGQLEAANTAMVTRVEASVARFAAAVEDLKAQLDVRRDAVIASAHAACGARGRALEGQMAAMTVTIRQLSVGAALCVTPLPVTVSGDDVMECVTRMAALCAAPLTGPCVSTVIKVVVNAAGVEDAIRALGSVRQIGTGHDAPDGLGSRGSTSVDTSLRGTKGATVPAGVGPATPVLPLAESNWGVYASAPQGGGVAGPGGGVKSHRLSYAANTHSDAFDDY